MPRNLLFVGFLTFFLFCSTGQVQNRKNIIYGKWFIDYRKTVEELMLSHNLQIEDHEHLFLELVQKFQDEFPLVELKIEHADKKDLWELVYVQKTQDTQEKVNSIRGTFHLLSGKHGDGVTGEFITVDREVFLVEIKKNYILKFTLQERLDEKQFSLYFTK